MGGLRGARPEQGDGLGLCSKITKPDIGPRPRGHPGERSSPPTALAAKGKEVPSVGQKSSF